MKKILRKYRLKSALSQEELFVKVGPTFHTIFKIETGVTNNPRVLTLEKLAKVLNIRIDDLMK